MMPAFIASRISVSLIKGSKAPKPSISKEVIFFSGVGGTEGFSFPWPGLMIFQLKEFKVFNVCFVSFLSKQLR